MLEQILSLALHLVELRLTLVDDILLCVEVLASVFKIVACTLIFTLLLVELEFTLLHLGLHRLEFRHFLLSLLLGLGSDFQGFFTAFKHLVTLEVLCFALCLGHDHFRARGRHLPLYEQRHTGCDGSCDGGDSDVNYNLHILD